MKITITCSSIVKPAEATWNGRIQLAEWDQIGYISHIPSVHIYRPQHLFLDLINHPSDTLVSNLRDSLSKILVHFYPLAGRLRWTDAGRLELDCDASGVQFVLAQTEARLDDLGEFSTSPEIRSLAPCIDYKTTPFEELPLLFVQITKFQCGGVSICPAMSHAVADGRGASYFLNEWARLARGEQLEKEPLHDRRLLRAGEPPAQSPPPDFNPFLRPPLLIGETSDKEERKKETTVTMLRLTKNQVEMLKKKANEEQSNNELVSRRPYSRYETITGHIWRCASKARGHKHEQATGLGISVDIRRRMQSQIPANYFGKATIDVVATGCSGDLVSRPLSYSANRVREAIDKVTADHVNLTIDFWKNQEDLSGFQDLQSLTGDDDEGPFYGNPNLGVTSWLTLPFQGLDFGWGKEIYMGPVTHDFDGDFIVFPDDDDNEGGGGGLILRACLQTPHMEVFKKLFYEDILSENN